ncbi:MAG: plasmid pRiA4b ORF-3 family protein [Phormidesmis sp. RL_2_1]|nr:plasmid pRiA4b ORF-3 family protein [Phormidesmis sp. RL_2_1]
MQTLVKTILPKAYQLKVTLVDSEPEVWRRILIPADVTLAALHDIVQRAMGWENQHDYAFRLGIGQAPCDQQKYLADALAIVGNKPIYYTYDFESGWLHRIERIVTTMGVSDGLTLNPVIHMAICLEGAAACPPEGTGGVWGYDELLMRLEDPEDPQYLDLLEQYGGFDPSQFDLAKANARLAITS